MDNAEERQLKSSFRRDLSLWQACALVIGSMIGTGIFFFVSPVAQYLLNPWAILSAWCIGGAIALCGALCLAELSATYPSTGGIYVYISRAFGPYAGFLYTWTKFLMMRVGSLAIPALAFAGFFTDFFNLSSTVGSEIKKPLAISVIAVLTVINTMGVRFGGWTQSLLTILKLICLFFIVVSGIVYMGGYVEPKPLDDLDRLLENLSPASNISEQFIINFIAALIPILWTLGGWDEPPYVAEEIANPQRNLPLSILIGIIVVAFLYIAVNGAYLAILTPSELAASGSSTAIFAMRRVFGAISGQIIALFLMISCLGVLNGMILTGARIAFAAGQDHLLFAWFNQINSVTKTPQRSLIIQGMLTSLAIIFSDDMLSVLMYTGIPYWLFSALMAYALFVLRKKDPDIERPFTTWGYPFVPIIFLIASLAMMISIAFDKSESTLIALVIFSIGSILYLAQYLLEKQT